jgi:predicted DNA-binding transcriptional regulator YafY
VNRTDRLYAIIEELRAVAPRPRSARWLAERFEVSVRTVERDVSALQQAGNPIWAEPGRTGGYCLDRTRTLPPVNFTPQEAVALAVAIEGMPASPFRPAARAAHRKVVAAMRSADAEAARELAARVHVLEGDDAETSIPALVADALSVDRVLRIGYRDRDGDSSVRDIEPLGYIENSGRWYLVAWCRLREGVRAFRTDRIESVTLTAEVPPPRRLVVEDLDIPYGEVRRLGSF